MRLRGIRDCDPKPPPSRIPLKLHTSYIAAAGRYPQNEKCARQPCGGLRFAPNPPYCTFPLLTPGFALKKRFDDQSNNPTHNYAKEPLINKCNNFEDQRGLTPFSTFCLICYSYLLTAPKHDFYGSQFNSQILFRHQLLVCR